MQHHDGNRSRRDGPRLTEGGAVAQRARSTTCRRGSGVAAASFAGSTSTPQQRQRGSALTSTSRAGRMAYPQIHRPRAGRRFLSLYSNTCSPKRGVARFLSATGPTTPRAYVALTTHNSCTNDRSDRSVLGLPFQHGASLKGATRELPTEASAPPTQSSERRVIRCARSGRSMA